MTTIRVTHLDRNGKVLDGSFLADLNKYKAVNKSTGFDWDKALTCFINGEVYTTVNMAYGNIRLELVN
jgi:hypothetical protein